MSALLDTFPRYRTMAAADVDAVTAIENEVYPHPWTRGNFEDSLSAGYDCWILEYSAQIIGYSLLMMALDEAHLLNLSVAPPWQRRGVGAELLQFMLRRARDAGAEKIFLEVRPSNVAGRGLYRSAGFSEIAIRRGYYPTHQGREDAVVMEMDLV
jgi:ribosomal-protein-alanine N-acetyltransferase